MYIYGHVCNMDNTDRIKYLLAKLKELKELLDKDEEDGFILRPNIRQRWVDHMTQLNEEYEELIKNN